MGCNKLIDLHNKRFGRLTVLKIAGKSGCETTWLCKCDCGNMVVAMGGNLRAGRTKSCGCLHDETVKTNSKTHGKSNTRLHRIWKDMKTRCYNPKFPQYKYWGGKGVRICKEWLESFESFYEWAINNGYSDTLSIDRIDSDGDYSPSNCRWADNYTQNQNRKFGGKKYA
ncbi:MAG: hypothetical protein IIY21_20200 [Clostridiales bacterium]|nr:hypothetical protein [Clostridiales bacterium]